LEFSLLEEPKRIPPDIARKALLTLISVYGLSYLIFIIMSFVPLLGQAPAITSSVPYDPSTLQQIFVVLASLPFLLGYLLVWKNEAIGGAIFILWWGVIWGLEIFHARIPREGPAGGGCGVVLGVPPFVLGILFIVNWFKERRADAIRGRS
jgi:hypothetical protein